MGAWFIERRYQGIVRVDILEGTGWVVPVPRTTRLRWHRIERKRRRCRCRQRPWRGFGWEYEFDNWFRKNGIAIALRLIENKLGTAQTNRTFDMGLERKP